MMGVSCYVLADTFFIATVFGPPGIVGLNLTIPIYCLISSIGLMIGIEFEQPIAALRKSLLFNKKIFTGVTGTNVIRLLPPLCLSKQDANSFITKFKEAIAEQA